MGLRVAHNRAVVSTTSKEGICLSFCTQMIFDVPTYINSLMHNEWNSSNKKTLKTLVTKALCRSNKLLASEIKVAVLYRIDRDNFQG